MKITPDPQDYAKVEREYCIEHGITTAVLRARTATDMNVAADLYRLAQATKLIRTVWKGER